MVTNMKNKYSHVIFDLDGTVYDTEYAYTTALYTVLKKYRPDTEETYESLKRFMSCTAKKTQSELGFDGYDTKELSKLWCASVLENIHTIKLYDGVLGIIKYLKEQGIKLGIVTSRAKTFSDLQVDVISPCPNELAPYFDVVISADDVNNPKPSAEPLLKYMEITGAQRNDILFIGDTQNDIDCAKNAGIDFGIALWGSHLNYSARCAHFFANPWDIVGSVFYEDNCSYQWLKWAKEIQAIGQVGLAYCTNIFDIERFERLREIASSMVAYMLHQKIDDVYSTLCMDKGYITPKLDTRAAVFDEKGRILLVKESRSNKWSLPGGWCDECETIYSNIIKEVREEAGMIVYPYRLVAILDKSKWNVFSSVQPFHILAAFCLCRIGEGSFTKNSETLERRFFSLDEIPVKELRTGTTTFEQIKMCFEAYSNKDFAPVID